jgi:hypothetical protein
MREAARNVPKHRASVGDLYALWAYAHHADRWDRVPGERAAVRRLFDSFASKPVEFDHEDPETDAAERLNAEIAGTIGYARIMRRAREAAAFETALARLAELATERVHHERADTDFVRKTRPGIHHAKIPRYVALTPDVCRILREHAGGELERNVRGLMADLPVWYQAFGERIIGGENYISPPHLARGLFAALADGVGAEAEELARYLDRPWCRADLYYIEKLTAVLRALDGAR